MLTLTLGIGVATSLLLLQITGLSAGGIISPGYVALVLDQPGALATLAATTALTWLIISLLARGLFLYGSRRFGVTILVAVTLSTGAQLLRVGFGPLTLDWGGFGFIVPGLIAHQLDRQGFVPTLLMLAIAAPLVRVLVTVLMNW